MELRTALYKGLTRAKILENLVCIVLIISSELNVMEKSLTAHESVFIELFVCKKSVSQAKNLCQKNSGQNSYDFL